MPDTRGACIRVVAKLEFCNPRPACDRGSGRAILVSAAHGRIYSRGSKSRIVTQQSFGPLRHECGLRDDRTLLEYHPQTLAFAAIAYSLVRAWGGKENDKDDVSTAEIQLIDNTDETRDTRGRVRQGQWDGSAKSCLAPGSPTCLSQLV